MNIITIIPARGGSKGILRKNIKEFCGQPLVCHIIKTALRVNEIDRVIVSTEDEEIAKIAYKCGAEHPFFRPETLATDETPTLSVLQHAIGIFDRLETFRRIDVVVLLYPTSPLVKVEHISKAINMLEQGEYDSVLSVVEDTGHYWVKDNNINLIFILLAFIAMLLYNKNIRNVTRVKGYI